jgi:hypothetical protein
MARDFGVTNDVIRHEGKNYTRIVDSERCHQALEDTIDTDLDRLVTVTCLNEEGTLRAVYLSRQMSTILPKDDLKLIFVFGDQNMMPSLLRHEGHDARIDRINYGKVGKDVDNVGSVRHEIEERIE